MAVIRGHLTAVDLIDHLGGENDETHSRKIRELLGVISTWLTGEALIVKMTNPPEDRRHLSHQRTGKIQATRGQDARAAFKNDLFDGIAIKIAHILKTDVQRRFFRLGIQACRHTQIELQLRSALVNLISRRTFADRQTGIGVTDGNKAPIHRGLM